MKLRLPAAAPVGAGLAGLLGRLAAVLPLVQAALDHAHREDEQREERDQEEARIGDDLVVGLAPQALAAVMTLGEGDGRGQGEQAERQQGGVEASAHRRGGYLSSDRIIRWPSSSPQTSPRTWRGCRSCAASR